MCYHLLECSSGSYCQWPGTSSLTMTTRTLCSLWQQAPSPSNMPFYTCMSLHWGKSELLDLLTSQKIPGLWYWNDLSRHLPSTMEGSCFLPLWTWKYVEWEHFWQTYSVPKLHPRKQFLASPKYIWQLLWTQADSSWKIEQGLSFWNPAPPWCPTLQWLEDISLF